MARFVVLLLAAVVCVSAKSLKGKSKFVIFFKLFQIRLPSKVSAFNIHDNRKGLEKSGAKFPLEN